LRLFGEILQVEQLGKMDSKLPVDAGFIFNKAPATAAMLRENIHSGEKHIYYRFIFNTFNKLI
jgi:hypothetical protein